MRQVLFLTLVSLLGAAPLKFEVASVKKSTSGYNGIRGGCHGIDSKYSAAELAAAPPLGRCVITDGRLSHLIGIAYGVSMAMIQNAPDWVIAGDERFNIEAKAEDPAKATEAQLRAVPAEVSSRKPGYAGICHRGREEWAPAQGGEGGRGRSVRQRWQAEARRTDFAETS
jgi:Protein of unknown function (DUF3738)